MPRGRARQSGAAPAKREKGKGEADALQVHQLGACLIGRGQCHRPWCRGVISARPKAGAASGGDEGCAGGEGDEPPGVQIHARGPRDGALPDEERRDHQVVYEAHAQRLGASAHWQGHAKARCGPFPHDLRHPQPIARVGLIQHLQRDAEVSERGDTLGDLPRELLDEALVRSGKPPVSTTWRKSSSTCASVA